MSMYFYTVSVSFKIFFPYTLDILALLYDNFESKAVQVLGPEGFSVRLLWKKVRNLHLVSYGLRKK